VEEEVVEEVVEVVGVVVVEEVVEVVGVVVEEEEVVINKDIIIKT